MCVCVQVTYKLSDKEQTLEEEIQLRERAQLQCKQAERTVEDLRMELQTLTQSRDELSKQLKLAQVHTHTKIIDCVLCVNVCILTDVCVCYQESIIDLEGDLEEQQENEQRWASKHKRALDQVNKHHNNSNKSI